MILEFLSFWLVAPEIIGDKRLAELLAWLQQLLTRANDITNSRWFGYSALAFGLGLSFLVGSSLPSSPTEQTLPFWPGGWSYLSDSQSEGPPLPLRAAMAVGYSLFAMAMWYGFCEWWRTASVDSKHIIRIGLIAGYALFSFGLGYLTVDLLIVYVARSAWGLALVIAAWGIACFVLWVLLTMHLDRWWAWMGTIAIYDIGAWVLLGYVSDGARSFLGLTLMASVLAFSAFVIAWQIAIPGLDRFVMLVHDQPDLPKKLILVGAATYVVSFVLQFIST